MSKLRDLDKQMTATRLREHVHALWPAKKSLGIPSGEMANKLAGERAGGRNPFITSSLARRLCNALQELTKDTSANGALLN